MTKPFPFTRLTPEEAMAQYPALFATFKAEFSWSGIARSDNFDWMIAAMVSIAVDGMPYVYEIRTRKFYGIDEQGDEPNE